MERRWWVFARIAGLTAAATKPKGLRPTPVVWPPAFFAADSLAGFLPAIGISISFWPRLARLLDRLLRRLDPAAAMRSGGRSAYTPSGRIAAAPPRSAMN